MRQIMYKNEHLIDLTGCKVLIQPISVADIFFESGALAV